MYSPWCSQIRDYCGDKLDEDNKEAEKLRFQPTDVESKVKTCLEEKFAEGKIAPDSDCGKVGACSVVTLLNLMLHCIC